jgi:protein ImuA
MAGTKADIIAQLQKEILSMQGFKPASYDNATQVGLGVIKDAFPNATFPLAAVHEFICLGDEESAATDGFIAGMLGSIIRDRGTALWIGASRKVFPPALKSFGIAPDKIIFVNLKKEKERLWAIEEALKCDSISSVVGEISEVSFTESRRFQLAVEQSKVTGFLIRHNPKTFATASVTRWRIQPLPSEKESNLPGLGFPRWNVELLKVRNGKPGSWQMEWRRGKVALIQQPVFVPEEQQRKIG